MIFFSWSTPPFLFNLLQILLYTLQPSFGDPNSSEQSMYKIYIKSCLPSRQDFDDQNPVKSCGKTILYEDCSLEYRAKLSGAKVCFLIHTKWTDDLRVPFLEGPYAMFL